jgi:transcription initiation factor TFIIB
MATAGFTPFEESRPAGEFKEDLNRILICKDCKEDPPNLIEEYSSGDMVCGSCGLVLDRIIDTRSEWRTFSGDDNGNDDPSRVGDAPNLMIDGDQLQTAIAFDGKGARNLAHLQNKINQDKGTKALMNAYRDIQALTDSINAGTQVGNTAKHIFKMVEDKKALKGKSQEAIVAGCIFIACRQTNVPRTFREIYGLTKVSKKEIGRVFKQLEAFLQKMGGEDAVAKATGYGQQYTGTAATTADELCVRFCSQLGFPSPVYVEGIARRLAARASEVSDLAGRSPLSIAAACIYMASYLAGHGRTYKQVSKAVDVSDGTVKTAYRFLYAAKDIVLTKEVFSGDGYAEVLANIDKVPSS